MMVVVSIGGPPSGVVDVHVVIHYFLLLLNEFISTRRKIQITGEEKFYNNEYLPSNDPSTRQHYPICRAVFHSVSSLWGIHSWTGNVWKQMKKNTYEIKSVLIKALYYCWCYFNVLWTKNNMYMARKVIDLMHACEITLILFGHAMSVSCQVVMETPLLY